MNTLEGDINSLKAVGHGALALINAAIVLAIVAVVLSTKAQTAQALTAIFGFLSWLVAQVIAPLQTVPPLAFSNVLTPAAAVTFGSGDANSGSILPTNGVTGSPATVTGSPATVTGSPATTGQIIPGAPTDGFVVGPGTPTCFATVNGKFQEVFGNPDGSCPGA